MRFFSRHFSQQRVTISGDHHRLYECLGCLLRTTGFVGAVFRPSTELAYGSCACKRRAYQRKAPARASSNGTDC